MKKKILFIMPSMFIGGAERSLLGLLDVIDYSQYDVSLFLLRHEGEFLPLIPKEAKILAPIKEYATFDVPIAGLLKSRLWRYGAARISGKLRLRHLKKTQPETGIWAAMQYTSRSLLPLLPDIPGEYDLGITFLGIPDVLLEKVNSRKKIAWNHTDYTILGPDKAYDRELYQKLDFVVSVSETCTGQLLKSYPELQEKAITIENVLSKRLVKLQAEASDVTAEMLNDGCIKLLSIGRFSDQKNFDNVPDICRRILEAGLDIRWYLIGYGGDEPLIRQRIQEAGMEDRVMILGKKENPYPYIKACDLYVQPSRYEGKAVTVREAQMLCKPVVITRYATSASQLEDGVDGVIVPMDNEGCAAGIAAVIRDEKLRQKLIENTKARDYTNAEEIQKIYRVMEA